MRRVILNQWFLLAALLILGFTAFSVLAYQKTRTVCAAAESCKKPASNNNGEMIWEAASRQFSSFISIQ